MKWFLRATLTGEIVLLRLLRKSESDNGSNMLSERCGTTTTGARERKPGVDGVMFASGVVLERFTYQRSLGGVEGSKSQSHIARPDIPVNVRSP